MVYIVVHSQIMATDKMVTYILSSQAANYRNNPISRKGLAQFHLYVTVHQGSIHVDTVSDYKVYGANMAPTWDLVWA